MAGWHGVPAAVLDRDPGLVADRLEADLDLGVLAGLERGLTPAEHQPVRRRPGADLTDLEHLAAGQGGREPPALARLERQHAGIARREREQRAGLPPRADVVHKRGER